MTLVTAYTSISIYWNSERYTNAAPDARHVHVSYRNSNKFHLSRREAVASGPRLNARFENQLDTWDWDWDRKAEAIYQVEVGLESLPNTSKKAPLLEVCWVSDLNTEDPSKSLSIFGHTFRVPGEHQRAPGWRKLRQAAVAPAPLNDGGVYQMIICHQIDLSPLTLLGVIGDE